MALLANLPDSSLAADSNAVWNGDALSHSQIHSRLHNMETGIGGWLTGNRADPWIQANLLNVYHVSAVATQGRGRSTPEQWVTEYTLSYCYFNELALQNVLDEAGNTKVFSGNSERFDVVTNSFFPVRAQIMRLMPTGFHGAPTLRWELYGCITSSSESVFTSASRST